MSADTGLVVPSHDLIAEPVLVAGRSAMVSLDPARGDEAYLNRLPLRYSGLVQANGTPHPLASLLYRNRRFAPPIENAPTYPEDRLDGLSILGGMVSMHFGHALTQSLGRLWAHEIAPDAPILFFPETLGVTTLPKYLIDLARSFGVHNPLRLVAHSTVCARLIVPSDICNLAHRPSVTPYFRDWLALRRPSVSSGNAERLYVSRSRLAPQQGHYLQERLLEDALVPHGYRIFHPQDHAIAEQIEAYLGASHLIFAEGSSAHLWSLVAPGGQKVAVIQRRPRDRAFANWFRSLDCGPIHFLNHAVADFSRRGDGPGRSVSFLDMRAVWDRLRELGFHSDSGQIGVDCSQITSWVATLPPRFKFVQPPFDLDNTSRDILSLRRHAALR